MSILLFLYYKCGFTLIGTHHKTGFKLGSWNDVAWLEKKIGEHDEKPGNILLINELPTGLLKSILGEYFDMKKALFWDFDGTLIHANESFLESLHSTLESCGHDIQTDIIRKFLRSTSSWYTPEVSYTDKIGEKWWDTLFQKFGVFYDTHGIVKAEHEKLNTLFRNRVTDFRTYTLYGDATAVLRECMSRGYKNYIISNNYPELPATIKDFGLSEYFTEYFVSANIGYEKPRIEIFQYALNAADSPEIRYMIGDNPIADIQGGKAAGMKTVLVNKDGDYDCDYKCAKLSDIPAHLI